MGNGNGCPCPHGCYVNLRMVGLRSRCSCQSVKKPDQKVHRCRGPCNQALEKISKAYNLRIRLTNDEVLGCVAAVVNYHYQGGVVHLGSDGWAACRFTLAEWERRVPSEGAAMSIWQSFRYEV